MKQSKNISLPFFFVTSLSIALMIIIIYARLQADKSISSLRQGNLNAVNVFKLHVLRDEIIDGIYTVEFNTIDLSASNDVHGIKDTIRKVRQDMRVLDSLVSATENRLAGKKLLAFADAKLQPFEALLADTLTDKHQLRSNAKIVANQTKTLSDSIYFSAIDLEERLSDYLQKNIADNEKLAVRVSKIDLRLTYIIIAAIAILATIIILRLLQNFKLLKAVHTERLEAEKAARVKEQFLANMSHEVKTPINSVVGFTKLLEKTDLTSEQQQYVTLINTAGANLLNIVNDILDISKIEAGMLHFDKTPFSVREVCYNIEMMFVHRAKDKHLYFHTFVDDAVPQLLIGDKERLFQVLMNLLSNAVKFTREGGISFQVQVKDFAEGAVTLQFMVEDTGVGIKKDKLHVIFERFEQAETDTTIKYGGTGLGLAIVKNLIAMQGGKIRVTSEEGTGSAFEFEITYPVHKQKARDIFPVLSKPNDVLLPDPAFTGKNVLIAEDNKMNQILLTKIFEQLNIQITITENGAKALDALRHRQFNLILMDVQMPVMDGYMTSIKIRNELNSSIPIIAMTAKVLPGEKEKCIAAGMNDYISKPIDETAFYNMLLTYLSSNKPTQIAASYIDISFLNNLFQNSNEAITEIVNQFIIQFPAELQQLTAAVDSKDIQNIKRVSHLMQTTVRSMNPASPLYKFLLEMEEAKNMETGWQTITNNLAALIKVRPEVMHEAAGILLNSVHKMEHPNV